MRRNNILAYTHYSFLRNKAGGERMLHYILKELSKKYKVDHYVRDEKPGIITSDNFTTIFSKDEPDYNSYDIIISHFDLANDSQLGANRYNKKFIFICHNSSRLNSPILKNKPDLVIFNSHHLKRHFRYRQSIIVHPPVFPNEHRTKKGDKITLVNPLPEKGGWLVYNLTKLMPNHKFLVVIGGYYSEQQEQVLTFMRQQKNIEIIPQQSDMREVWKKTKILLMPSSQESYWLVGREGLSSGIPSICYKSVYTDGAYENLGESAMWLDNFSLSKWKQAILNMENPIVYEDYSKRALKQVRTVDSNKEIQKLIDRVNLLCES